MKKLTLLFPLVFFATTAAAHAQALAPAPRAMPRVPVTHQSLEQRDPMPSSHQVQGPAAIIDGEKLRIAETDLRLFGIVPPQLAASFGPQARSALDSLANGQSVSCQIRDRDRDGRLLATCQNAAGSDMALELLKRGLAVTARGSLTGSELANTYLAAELSAQNQHLGLWSTTAPAPVAAVATTPSAAQPSPAVKQEVAALAAVLPAFAGSDTGKRDEKVAPRTDKIVPTPDVMPPTKAAIAETQAKAATVAAEVLEQHVQAQQAQHAQQAQIDQSAWIQNDSVGFFERYQILIAGFLMLITALSIIGALWEQKRRDKRDETRAVAAALRGELMAARGICIGRIKTVTGETDDASLSWPRIRITLYQAYVGRLGLLGAELARQVASIYGQSSDYTALYNSPTAAIETPKKQALETLIRNIDEILPKLAFIEQTGLLPSQNAYAYSRPAYYNPQPVGGKPAPTYRPELQAQKPVETKHALPPEIKVAEHETTDLSHPLPIDIAHPISHPVAPPVALWEAVRGFIQSHRNAIAQYHTPRQPSPDPQSDPHVAEYAAMIEADMARYRYTESVESFDVSPQKKRI